MDTDTVLAGVDVFIIDNTVIAGNVAVGTTSTEDN